MGNTLKIQTICVDCGNVIEGAHDSCYMCDEPICGDCYDCEPCSDCYDSEPCSDCYYSEPCSEEDLE